MRRVILAVMLALADVVLSPAVARAAPLCDAGACRDDDGDGFASCTCTPLGIACDCDDTDATIFPGAPEACDAPKDHDCNGRSREGCAAGTGCLASQCVPECLPLDDFGCPGGSYFADGDRGQCLCAPIDCTSFGCAPGSTCNDAKTCRPTCTDDVRCPAGQICRGDGCVEPCGEDTSAPSDCEGVVCPDRRVCRVVAGDAGTRRGRCVELCAPDPCTLGFACEWRTGECRRLPAATGGLVPPPEARLSDDGLRVEGGGLACTASRAAGLSASALAVLGAAVALGWRRRRAVSASRRG